jgi:hypothetical protein
MTYPPSGGSHDPYQPQQPYGQPYDPTAPYSSDPYAAPAGGTPASGAPSSGQPYPPPFSEAGKGQPYGAPYSGGPYGGQQPYQPYGPQTRTNGLAIASLVCSLVGFATCISAPVGVVLGHLAKRQIRETGEGGEGMATAGLWIGYILSGLFLAFLVLWVILLAAGVFAGASSSY